MSFYVLDDERCKMVSSGARALWAEFLDLYPHFSSLSLLADLGKNQNTDRDRPLLTQRSFPRNECVEAFCRHCAKTMTKLPGLVINWLSLQNWVPMVKGRPSSWVHELKEYTFNLKRNDEEIQAKFDQHILVLVDLEYIASQSPMNLDRLWICLLLHEVGHLVLHWDDFGQQRLSNGKAMATDQQEAEAWFFQSVVIGLALGSYARSCVIMPRGTSGDIHEDAWKYVT